MLTLQCPAASQTSASGLPPARAWLINVWRPWWMVSDSRRAASKILHAVRKRLRSVWRENAAPGGYIKRLAEDDGEPSLGGSASIAALSPTAGSRSEGLSADSHLRLS